MESNICNTQNQYQQQTIIKTEMRDTMKWRQ